MGLLNVFTLFTPAPATPQQISATNPGTDWLTKLIAVCSRLGLQVTDWSSGGVARTIMTAYSWMMSTEDALVSGMVQGGFLDYAATGTVSYVDPTDGVTVIVVPVTLDPSTNPGAPVGWLDILASSVYDCERIIDTGGTGTMAIVNTGSSTGSYQPGQYHVTNPSNGLTYSNEAAFSIGASSVVGTSIASVSNTSPAYVTTATSHGLASGAYVGIVGVGVGTGQPNGIWQITVISATQFILQGSAANGAFGPGGTVYVGQGVDFEADVQGAGTSVAGSISQAVTVLPGVVVTNPQAFIGAVAESNVALAARCRLKLQSLSPNGAKAAYAFFALTAFQLLAVGGTQNPNGTFNFLSTPVTKVLVLPQTTTGTVQVVLANASGPLQGITDLLVTGATVATLGAPIVISTAAPHGLASGSVATISGVIGIVEANGTWQITNLTSNSFSIPVTSTNSYAGGGVIEGGDLGEVDALLQELCVPNAITETTSPATPVAVAVTGTIYCQATYASQANAAVQAALLNYQVNLDIGGVTLPGEGTNIAPYDEILGIAESALPQILNITPFKLNGATADVSLGPTGLLSFSSFSFTIVPV